MLHGHIFDTIAQDVCRTADYQTFEKRCESDNFVASNVSAMVEHDNCSNYIRRDSFFFSN